MKKFYILLTMISLSVPLFTLAQWSDDPAVNTPVCTDPGEQALCKVAIGANDNVFISYFDAQSGNYHVMLQYLNRDGFFLWSQPVLVSDHNQDSWISDYDTRADHDGNCLTIFSDIRNGNTNPVIYKISPTGQHLWGPDGITVSTDPTEEYSPVLCVTSENKVVTAFTRSTDSNYPLVMVAYDENGNTLWQEGGIVLVPEGNFSYWVPVLVPVSGGDFIVVVSKRNGTSLYAPRYIYAMRYHIDGTPAWSQEIIISDAGGINSWTDIQVKPDAHDGVIVAWHDDRNSDMVSSAFVQHVDGDGNLLLVEDGVELSLNANHQRFYPQIAGEDVTSGDIFLFWYETDYDQISSGLTGQAVSSIGTRLWGQNGKVIIPLGNSTYSIFGADLQQEQCYVFYGAYGFGTTDVRIKATCTDRGGNFVWPAQHIFISNTSQEVIHPYISVYAYQQWIIGFTSTRGGTYDIYSQNMNDDGTLGINPIAVPEISAPEFSMFPNPVSDRLTIQAAPSDWIRISDPAGKIVWEQEVIDKETVIDMSFLNPGIYFVTVTGEQGMLVKKVVHAK
ncbi:MAG TPA: T9SS type A sorting domain-containing protein [Bacteroidales bacterium]|nr:T9SS type A sorting domain-containing protein [Bacteroidales bacterium]HRZ20768.1 T9SS type A sorting domain-containing protein [Bacteroidales bacterium]